MKAFLASVAFLGWGALIIHIALLPAPGVYTIHDAYTKACTQFIQDLSQVYIIDNRTAAIEACVKKLEKETK